MIVLKKFNFEVAFRFCICGLSFRGELLARPLRAVRLHLPLRHLLRDAPHRRGILWTLHCCLHLTHQVQTYLILSKISSEVEHVESILPYCVAVIYFERSLA